MDKLRKQVRRAQWWLGVQRFVSALGWCWSVALLAALALILVDKYWPLGIEAWGWGVGALGVGFLTALIWAIFTGRGPLDAAIEIDRRFGLKERVSSSLALSPPDRDTDLGQALVADAARQVERIDVPSRFGVAPPRQLLYPLLPGLAAVLVALLVSPAGPDPALASGSQTQQVKKTTQAVQGKIIEQRKKAETQGLENAKEFFGQLERDLEGMSKSTDRKETLVKLNDVARQMAERRRELAGADALKKQLNALDQMGKGPADKLLEEITRGNFKNAVQQLEKLKTDLAGGKLTPDEQKQLAQQMEAMKQKLEKLVEAQRQAEQDLQKRIDQARQAGQNDKAEQLQQQLNQQQAQAQQMQKLNQMAQKLGQCANCLKNGNLQDGEAMLDQLQDDMQAMAGDLEEMDLLDDAMDQIGKVKKKLGCANCEGEGCEMCDEIMEVDFAQGGGRGAGKRAEAEDKTKFFDAKSPVKTGPGKASVVGEADGPNVAGSVQQEIQEQFAAAKSDASDPLTNQRMPRKHRAHAQEYFERFREGQ